MAEKDFAIEKLSWFLNQDLRQDIRLRFKTLASFLDANKLSSRTLVPKNGIIPDDFELWKSDLTVEGYAFIQAYLSTWIQRIDHGSDEGTPKLLEKYLQKFRAAKTE